jgi:hypothetical protein
MGNSLMPSISITWHAVGDDRTCPICRAIDGYTWTFVNEVPDSLVHPEYGEIWNVTTGSLAHEQKQFGKKYGLLSNCRCKTDANVEARDLIYLLQKKIDELKGQIEEAPDYQKGSSRKTTFEDIGIDASKYGFE